MMDFRKSFRWESRRSEPVMLLKEYLKDDLGSCSSAGFESFLRRPSCSSSSLSASVRFLIDIDLRSNTPTPDRGLSRSLSASLFRSAAAKIVSAVKLPLRLTCFLLLGGSQTEKFSSDRVDEDARRWSSLGNEDGNMLGKDAAAASSIHSGGSDSSRVNCDGNGVASGSKDATVIDGEIVNGTEGEDGIGHGLTGPSSKECLQGKLPFALVSVLNCCEDDELTIDARSEQNPGNVNTRGGEHRHDGLSRLAPAELEEQISLPEVEEEATRLVVVEEEVDELEEQEEEPKDNVEAILERMLKTMKVDVRSYDSKWDVLLLDFFREKLVEWEEHRYAVQGWDSFVDEVVDMAEEWMRGKPKEAYVGWEIEGRRMAYIKDMERGGDLAGHEVCLEVDNVVWTLLVYEAIIDIFV